MLRAIIAVIAGYALWTALWLGGNALLFTDAAEAVARDEAFTAPGPLAGILVLSIICSLAAGLTAAAIAPKKATPAALTLALLLLATGIAVQAGAWSLMPVWYHLTFLILLVPITMLGARLAPVRSGRT
jgi:hypothetical protein